MNKKELRKEYLEKRKALSEDAYLTANQKIKSLFFEKFVLEPNANVHVFLPIVKKGEIDTWPIIHELWKRNVNVAVPKTNFETMELEHYQLTAQSKLERNHWGIEEPVAEKTVKPSDIDIVLVPLLTFDRQGHRVGYGKGFYDKFLEACRPDTIKIGLSIFPPISSIDDVHKFDVSLNHCIIPDNNFIF